MSLCRRPCKRGSSLFAGCLHYLDVGGAKDTSLLIVAFFFCTLKRNYTVANLYKFALQRKKVAENIAVIANGNLSGVKGQHCFD